MTKRHENRRHTVIHDPVMHGAPVSHSSNDALGAQPRQLLRNIGLAQTKRLFEFAHLFRLLDQEREYSQPPGVAEDLKEPRAVLRAVARVRIFVCQSSIHALCHTLIVIQKTAYVILRFRKAIP